MIQKRVGIFKQTFNILYDIAYCYAFWECKLHSEISQRVLTKCICRESTIDILYRLSLKRFFRRYGIHYTIMTLFMILQGVLKCTAWHI